jgi:hypothetical protein
MNKAEFESKRTELRNKIEKLRNDISELEQAYLTEVAERSGYKIGDRVSKDGHEGVVTGFEFFIFPKLVVCKFKKDGTPSSIRDHHLSITLKEV